MTVKYVYSFEEGNAGMKELMGGKGANLAEMTKIGINVPPGFTLTTEACNSYQETKEMLDGIWRQTLKAIKHLETQTGKGFGSTDNPLLLSVRSGAAVSMPGMMDTVLNLGLNPDTVQGMITKTGNERFVYDSYRRFIHMFANVVLGMPHEEFNKKLEERKENAGVKLDSELNADQLKGLVEDYKAIIKEAKVDWPDDPEVQLKLSIEAVFRSWNLERARVYREANGIPHDLGTAVNIQTMVFGNSGDNSGTGVAFSRNPSNGENKIYGEYLMNAQGEDVVAGIRTPLPIENMEKELPDIYKKFWDIMYKTEKHYGDMQDMEFTIEDGELFILQTRTGKRTASAAIKIAVDLVIAGIIPREEALMRIEPATLNQLLHKRLDLSTKVDCMTKGLPASPGAAAGEAVFSADEAQRLKEEEGKDVILVSSETSPEDIHGMIASEGILTSRGGMTSHAAVVARGMGKPCICGCEEMKITKGQFEVKGMIIKEGDWITLDGTTGSVFKGEIPTIDPEMTSEFKVFMKWADSIARMKVKTNAEVPHDVQVAKDFGAEGIGLARTEHMFFGDDRLPWMRRMVLASDEAERKVALDKLLPMQRQDFEEIFTIMDKLPVIIRLLDPPLHEFLPKSTEEIKELSQALDIPVEKIEEAIESQHEFNPMLGFRGCRLGILFPEINAMQARAIFEAGLNVKAKGITPIIQVEIPLIGKLEEYRLIKNIIQDVAKDMQIEGKLEYQIGSMIEVPRAALTADELAAEMDFMSFGTNDLTQMTCGLSRDDAGKFLGLYVEKGVYDKDPFSSIDQEGVGLLMKICIDKARKIKPDMEIGICGEHGGEPESVKFCHRIGIDDVSCSPFRVPIAKLAAAQAVIEERMK